MRMITDSEEPLSGTNAFHDSRGPSDLDEATTFEHKLRAIFKERAHGLHP